ncbi:hypothetical protein ACEWY4_019585 [Coilia grayii]|uniref:Upstream stimulatory factor 2 n=1 Tax=Coilia grayii TaxID=363190 RepID=A0ABD1JA45_9TELE
MEIYELWGPLSNFEKSLFGLWGTQTPKVPEKSSTLDFAAALSPSICVQEETSGDLEDVHLWFDRAVKRPTSAPLNPEHFHLCLSVTVYHVLILNPMDMLEQGLDNTSSHEKPEEEVVQTPEAETSTGGEQTAVTIANLQQASAFTDQNIQYHFRAENSGGQVTYRVVQVTDQSLEGTDEGIGTVNVVSATAFPNASQAVTQAVIQSPFSNGGSPTAEAAAGETRFAYFPAATVSGGTAVSLQATADPTLPQAGGQFYVMMTPPDVQSGTPRTIAPRTHPYTAKVDGTRAPRDERRRAQHNEVERRRRDKINNWIVTLSKIIPDCNMDSSKTGASKGGILSKACDYIRELRQTNQRLQESFEEVERIQLDNELLRQQIEELKSENVLLRAQLQQHGMESISEATAQ